MHASSLRERHTRGASVARLAASVGRPISAVALLWLFGSAACSASAPSPDEPRRPAPRPRASASPLERGWLPATEIATVAGGTYGPYVGDRTEGTIAVWAELRGAGRSWLSTPITGSDAPARILEIAPAPAEIGLAVVKPAGGSETGFVLLFSERASGEEIVHAIELGARGELRGAPLALGRTTGRVVWVEVAATRAGSVALWAIERGDRAEIFAAELARARKLEAPIAVAKDARAWQAVAVEDGVAVGVTRAGEAGQTDRRGGAGVRVTFLDAGGQPAGSPVSLGSAPVELDLDLAASGPSLLAAWSERAGVEARVRLMALDAGRPPRALEPAVLEPLGEQALVDLIGAHREDAAWIAWENAGERAAGARRVRVARVRPDGTASSGAAIVRSEADALPELVASERGLGVLTLATPCRAGAACEPVVVPSFVELDRELRVLAATPLGPMTPHGGFAPSAWGLTCRAAGCLALVAQSHAPTPVHAARLPAAETRWQAAAEAPSSTTPRATSDVAIGADAPIADLDAIAIDDAMLVAWVTLFDSTTPWKRLTRPAPDGRLDPLAARLSVRRVDASGGWAEPQVVSLRARSLGGVALTAGDPARREALLAWSAIDAGQPQIFVTLLGADGKKGAQRMLTRRRGEVSDAAAAWAGDRWIVAWVDERSGDPEVYLAGVDRTLRTAIPERRLTSAPGAASSPVLLAQGDAVLVAWADARDRARPGSADVRMRRVRASDGAALGDEHVFETGAHSHSPVLERSADGALLAWIEAAEGAEPARAALVRIDAGGIARGDPSHVALAGTLSGLGLGCADVCRVVTLAEENGRFALAGFELEHRPAHLLAVETAPSGVSPVLVGDSIVYAAGRGDRGRGVVRRARVAWR